MPIVINDYGEGLMIEAGQFLSEPGAALTFFTGFGVIGVLLSLWTLMKLRSKYLHCLAPALDQERYFKGLAMAAGVSIGLTLFLQTIALFFLDTTAQLTEATGNRVAQMTGASPSINNASVRAAGFAAWKLSPLAKNKRAAGAAAIAVLVAILLLVVGAGYAFTALDLSFVGHFAAFSAGVGPVEEFTKALAGLAILYWVMPKDGAMTDSAFQRCAVASFGVAGLGFGAGEALHYFGTYSALESGLLSYIIRAVWCVTLHGAWTLIVGSILASRLPRDPEEIKKNVWPFAGMVFVACIPTILLHALYNACCVHESMFLWIVGALSLGAAVLVIESCKEPVPVPVT